MKEKQNLFKGKIIFMQKSLVSALLFVLFWFGLTESLMKTIIEAL